MFEMCPDRHLQSKPFFQICCIGRAMKRFSALTFYVFFLLRALKCSCGEHALFLQPFPCRSNVICMSTDLERRTFARVQHSSVASCPSSGSAGSLNCARALSSSEIDHPHLGCSVHGFFCIHLHTPLNDLFLLLSFSF